MPDYEVEVACVVTRTGRFVFCADASEDPEEQALKHLQQLQPRDIMWSPDVTSSRSEVLSVKPSPGADSVQPARNASMTVRQKIQNTLVAHGLWEEEAREVVAEAEKDEVLSAMQGRWEDDVAGYPVSVLSATWLTVRHLAVEWLKANKPEHFALHMLTAPLPEVQQS